MAHVVTERCVNSRYTDCCAVCPADCFYEVTDPAMLVIDPDTCIDCEACVAECPVQAIWPDHELPPEYKEWASKNRELVAGGTMINTKKEALSGAKSLAALQAAEKERGWTITEPSAAAGAEEEAAEPAAAEAAAVSQEAVLNATASGRFPWRSAAGLAAELGTSPQAIQTALDTLAAQGKVRQFANTNPKAPPVYGAVAKVGSA